MSISLAPLEREVSSAGRLQDLPNQPPVTVSYRLLSANERPERCCGYQCLRSPPFRAHADGDPLFEQDIESRRRDELKV